MSRVNGGARAKPEERREEVGFCSRDPGKDQGSEVLPDPALCLPHPHREARMLRTDPGLVLAQESRPGLSRAGGSRP